MAVGGKGAHEKVSEVWRGGQQPSPWRMGQGNTGPTVGGIVCYRIVDGRNRTCCGVVRIDGKVSKAEHGREVNLLVVVCVRSRVRSALSLSLASKLENAAR